MFPDLRTRIRVAPNAGNEIRTIKFCEITSFSSTFGNDEYARSLFPSREKKRRRKKDKKRGKKKRKEESEMEGIKMWETNGRPGRIRP